MYTLSPALQSLAWEGVASYPGRLGKKYEAREGEEEHYTHSLTDPMSLPRGSCNGRLLPCSLLCTGKPSTTSR